VYDEKPKVGAKYSKEEKAIFKEMIKHTYFKSLIWSSYRKNFEKELLYEDRCKKYLS